MKKFSPHNSNPNSYHLMVLPKSQKTSEKNMKESSNANKIYMKLYKEKYTDQILSQLRKMSLLIISQTTLFGRILKNRKKMLMRKNLILLNFNGQIKKKKQMNQIKRKQINQISKVLKMCIQPT